MPVTATAFGGVGGDAGGAVSVGTAADGEPGPAATVRCPAATAAAGGIGGDNVMATGNGFAPTTFATGTANKSGGQLSGSPTNGSKQVNSALDKIRSSLKKAVSDTVNSITGGPAGGAKDSDGGAKDSDGGAKDSDGGAKDSDE